MDIIKDCKAKIATKASSKKQSNIIVTKEVHKLYVLTFASKVANDPTWYVDMGATQGVLRKKVYHELWSM
jgi:hypothetical protein